MTDSVADVLRRYGLVGASVEYVSAGLINRTWLISHRGTKYILQRVNPMFTLEVHEDIAAVTVHLHVKGLVSPRLVPALNGEAAVRHDGGIWRLYGYLEGVTFNRADEPAIAREAGRVLAAFHEALLDLDYGFKNRRSGVHDTAAHLSNLRTALRNKRDHPRFDLISPLAADILSRADDLPPLPRIEARKVHGDPKINNCLFDEKSRAGICMIDFDTLGILPLPLELGDAMRSWCNPAGENAMDTAFSLETLRAGLEGYASVFHEHLTADEWKNILPATRVIYLELAARFCADALNEDFFEWDPRNFNSHSEHSQIRAAGQLNALKSLEMQLKESERIVEEIFGHENLT